MSLNIKSVAMIGFGEVGGIFGQDLTLGGREVAAFDILFCDARRQAEMLAKANSTRVRPRLSLEEAICGSDLVISVVTASSAAQVAHDAAPLMREGQVYLDMNSVSPRTKREMAATFVSVGATFVEAVALAPVPPSRMKVPMLLGGSHASQIAPPLNALGFNASVASDQFGVASAIKMCRSVVVKGLEALVVECLFAARCYQAEDAVLASLAESFPGMGWADQLPDYLISRVAQHGKRRADEMCEAAEAISDTGVDPVMANATAERQRWLVQEIAARGVEGPFNQSFAWRKLADRIMES